MAVSTETLAGVPLFSTLSAAAVEELAALIFVRHYRRGMFIFGEGEPADAFHILLHGAVRVFRTTPDGEEQTLHLVRDAGVLCLCTVASHRPYPAAALTLADSEVGVVRTADLARLARKHGELGWALLDAVTQRLLWAQGRIYDLGQRSASGRVASALLELAQDRGLPQPDGRLLIDMPLTHRELGRMTGVTRETVARMLPAFRELDAVRATGDGHLLVNPDALTRLLEPRAAAPAAGGRGG